MKYVIYEVLYLGELMERMRSGEVFEAAFQSANDAKRSMRVDTNGYIEMDGPSDTLNFNESFEVPLLTVEIDNTTTFKQLMFKFTAATPGVTYTRMVWNASIRSVLSSAAVHKKQVTNIYHVGPNDVCTEIWNSEGPVDNPDIKVLRSEAEVTA